MDASTIFIIISIAVLAVVALLIFFVFKKTKEKRLTPIAGLAFAFVLAGIIFGHDRLIGYSLLGVGVVLAVVDIVRKSRAARQSEPTSATGE
jgi:RsiW-degrading membrane proteinase PrsW (M82 family)